MSVVDYPPGEYDLTITAQDAEGQTVDVSLTSLQLTGKSICCDVDNSVIRMCCTEPPAFTATCILGPEELTLECSTSVDGTMVPLTYSCSYDNQPAEDCEQLHSVLTVGCELSVDCVFRWARSRDSHCSG